MLLLCAIALCLMVCPLASQPPPATDPFADLNEVKPPVAATARQSWFRSFFHENFGFRKEVLSQFTTADFGNPSGRISLGFEVLKKFSTPTATVASFNLQMRFVRRDRFNPVQNDMEGANRLGWFAEYHNLYFDFYNVFNPLLSNSQKGSNVGRFNIRAGRFYVPFGLNLQTDTHGTVLQLSNDRNFGFERDWYTGFWGSLNKHLNYDAYYSAGSGYDLKFRGQRGLASLRLSLANQYSSRYGIEAGFSTIVGERLSMHRAASHPISTRRNGLDVRYRRSVPHGLVTLTHESSLGSDNHTPLNMQLHQLEYLHASRRWGLATQYRRFRHAAPESSVIAEATWYLRNDVGNSSLHWFKLNVERRIGPTLPPHTITSIQYYFYR